MEPGAVHSRPRASARSSSGCRRSASWRACRGGV